MMPIAPMANTRFGAVRLTQTQNDLFLTHYYSFKFLVTGADKQRFAPLLPPNTDTVDLTFQANGMDGGPQDQYRATPQVFINGDYADFSGRHRLPLVTALIREASETTDAEFNRHSVPREELVKGLQKAAALEALHHKVKQHGAVEVLNQLLSEQTPQN